jgi:flagellar protein FlaG
VQAQAPAAPEGREVSDTTLRRAVTEINSVMATHSRHLRVQFHEATNRRIVAVYNSITNEVVREIPPERVLDAHANILEMAGLFLDARG